ncbi:MAG: hypothetical protein IJG45_00440 [Oscillospiraceae bacterium]|nr:hypothetical protein [Oscillospiraceae bacterium]
MTEWTPATLCEVESAALAKHCIVFLFVLVFLVYLFVAIKRRAWHRAETESRRLSIVLDLVFGGIFVSLFAVSIVLLLTPQNALRFSEVEQHADVLRGTVSEQYLRPYLWAPTSAGSYVVVEGKELYFTGLRASVIGENVELSFMPDTAYVLTLSTASLETSVLSYPWYLYAARGLMLVSGIYIVVRLGQISAREAVQMKKKQDKDNPLIQYYDLDRFL